MKDDERQCPNCGRDVLSWDTMCPGCEQVPWDTPAGRQVISRRRRGHFWRTSGPGLGLLVLVLGAIIIGNINLTRAMRYTQEASDLDRIVQRGLWLNAMLEENLSGSDTADGLRSVARQWLDDECPSLLAMVEDPQRSMHGRTAAAMSLGQIFQQGSPLTQLGPVHRRKAVEHLSAVFRDAPAQSLHVAAHRALRLIGVPASVLQGGGGSER